MTAPAPEQHDLSKCRIGTPYRADYGGFSRSDVDREGYHYHVHAASLDDRTPQRLQYDSRCGWCWIGAAHTEAVHAARVQQENDRLRAAAKR